MGTFTTQCLIANVATRKRAARLPSLLVDTGSESTWIPGEVLDGIGVEPAKSTSFRMANGRLIHRKVGYALVRVGRRETVDDVVFAEPGDYALLGARALEGLNLWVDAANKKLVPGRPWPLEMVIVGARPPKPGPDKTAAARVRRHRKVAVVHSAPSNLPVSPETLRRLEKKSKR